MRTPLSHHRLFPGCHKYSNTCNSHRILPQTQYLSDGIVSQPNLCLLPSLSSITCRPNFIEIKMEGRKKENLSFVKEFYKNKTKKKSRNKTFDINGLSVCCFLHLTKHGMVACDKYRQILNHTSCTNPCKYCNIDMLTGTHINQFHLDILLPHWPAGSLFSVFPNIFFTCWINSLCPWWESQTK